MAKLYAVITGDVIKSSEIEGYQDRLKETLELFQKDYSNILPLAVDRYGGDSFQVLLSDYGPSLRASLYIYTKLASYKPQIHVRMSIGIGEINGVPSERVSTGDGEAFRLSGPALEKLDSHQHLTFQGTAPLFDWKTNELLRGSMGLLSGLLIGLTPAQSEVLWYLLQGYTQVEIARKTNRAQQTISGIASVGNWRNIAGFVDSFEESLKINKIIQA